MREIIFEKEVNGYGLVLIEFEGRMDIKVLNGYNDIVISIAGILDSYEHLRNKNYSLIEFEIQTKSVGSKSAVGIEKLIEKYQKAVEAVEAFGEALHDLEVSELEVSE